VIPNIISYQYASEAVSYNQDTGILKWRIRPPHHFRATRGHKIFNTKHAGSKAGNLSEKGYLRLVLNGKTIVVHRIIFLLMTGRLPYHQIDHKNHNRSDNRWGNLREATNDQNHLNQKLNSSNTSGHTGVCWDKANKKWRALICFRGNKISLGRFGDIEDAISARTSANKKYGFHKNHGKTKIEIEAQER